MVEYSDAQRVGLGPLLAQLRGRRDFSFQKRVRGYYYEVEVWRWRGIDVVLEEASLAWLAESRQRWPELVFELVFHPNAVLCSTWQPWDGALGPPPTRPGVRGPGSGVRMVGEDTDYQAPTTNSPRWVGSRQGSL